jgi:small-conductance mechanosensitive channel
VPTAVLLGGEPPYPVPEVDALRDQRDSLQAQRAALALTTQSLDMELQAALQARRKADETLRLRREQHERGQSGTDAATLRGQLELARLQARVAELVVLQADEARAAARERQDRLAEPIATLGREIERVRQHQRLDDEDLMPLRQASAAELRRLQVEHSRVARELARRESSLQGQGPTALRELSALRGRLQAIDELQAIERGTDDLWSYRQMVTAAGTDRERRRAAAATLAQAARQLEERQRAATEQLELLRSEQRVQQSRVAAMGERAPELAAEERALLALQLQIDARQRVQEQLVRIGTLLARSEEDLGLPARPGDGPGWAEEGLRAASALLRSVWQYELFNATESTQVDGRVVIVDYGVTVGKSLGALVLFGAGYWLTSRLVSRLVATLVARAYLSPQLGRVLRRWLTSILVLLVLLVVLRMARVPLTAFAFVGGALAIGVGFGAQNIIKNLISGVIILFERMVRVGDVVTIGGISGTITAIDLRATTVRGFDGIESIVPNSTLLENQLSNWSYGSPEIRRAITVGVAYGSDARRTADLVLACAHRHAQVLAEPAPEVFLDDFGADSLVFRLLYWVRLGGTRSGPAVDSDIRFDIEATLREAGIAMAFPQRDVHLDAVAPLRVELSRARPAPAG